MSKTRYADEQIAFALRQAETGTPVKEVAMEGKNNRINAIKRMAYGYRNINNFRLRILITNSRGAGS